jgi:hypothetical protein
MHVNQYLVVGDLGLVDVPEFQNIGWAVGVSDDRLHRVLLRRGDSPVLFPKWVVFKTFLANFGET